MSGEHARPRGQLEKAPEARLERGPIRVWAVRATHAIAKKSVARDEDGGGRVVQA